MPSSPWDTYANGRLPAFALAPVGQGAHRLWPDAAAAWTQLVTAAKADGINIRITDSYRTYTQQVTAKQTKPGLTATPGRSNHGWGLAVDVDLAGNTGQWLAKNSARFGWVNPKSIGEPWHYEYAPITGSTSSRSTVHTGPANPSNPSSTPEKVPAEPGFWDGIPGAGIVKDAVGTAANIAIPGSGLVTGLFGSITDSWVKDIGRIALVIVGVAGGTALIVLGVQAAVGPKLDANDLAATAATAAIAA